MKAPHIVIIKQKYTAAGGSERFVERALEALGEENLRLTLITRRWTSVANAEIITCNPFHIGRAWRQWAFGRAACRIAAQWPTAIVQSHERTPCCDIYRAGDGVHREWLKQRARVEGALSSIGATLSPFHHFILRSEEKLYRSSRLKAVICNSNMVRDEIKHYFGLPDEKLFTIYNGIDHRHFHPGLRSLHRGGIRQRLGITETDYTLLFVGSGFLRKGLATCIAAAAKLPQNTHLIVIGRDKAQSRYQDLASNHGLNGRVHFLGEQRDVTPFYGAADALVLPSLYDPFANVVLEAMACGLPVVTSLKCGAVDIIQHGLNGFIRDALDVQGIIADLQELVDPAVREAVGHAARTTVLPLTPKEMSQRMLSLYTRLLPVAEARGAALSARAG